MARIAQAMLPMNAPKYSAPVSDTIPVASRPAASEVPTIPPPSHTRNIENLRRALDALIRGDHREAEALLSKRPLALSDVAPGWQTASEAVDAAHQLYLEALENRAELLRQVKEQHGIGPFRDGDGRLVHIVTRPRAGRDQVFLRTAR